MVKFKKEDFKYVSRVYIACDLYMNKCGYYYIFSVVGESANYLKNKYSLQNINIEVNLFADNSMRICSYKEHSRDKDIVYMAKEDVKELLPLLQEDMNLDFWR